MELLAWKIGYLFIKDFIYSEQLEISLLNLKVLMDSGVIVATQLSVK
jgi:hypothetical protein